MRGGGDKDKGDERWTPLLVASRNGDVDVVRFLCKIGADRDIQTKNGTPFSIAEHKGHLDVLDCLRENVFSPVHDGGNNDDDARPSRRQRLA